MKLKTYKYRAIEKIRKFFGGKSMKVKEAFSNDFKKDSTEEYKVVKDGEGTDRIVLSETFSRSGEHVYSTYCLSKNGKTIFFITMPNPLDSSSIEKDFYLKYQGAVRSFLVSLADFFTEQSTDCMNKESKRYNTEQQPDLKYKKTKELVQITLNDGTEVGFIDLGNFEKSEKLARNFIYCFQGKPLEYDWVEIK